MSHASGELLLGVDGGNTKTAALLAGSDGRLLGRGEAGCSDIYGAESPEEALLALDRAISEACEYAGAEKAAIRRAVLCVAGADWPEDVRFLECEARSLGVAGSVAVYNDAFGPLRAGSPDFVGVSVVCGTGAATGARSRSGALWHTSWWQEPHGARQLGQKALRAVYRAELGIGQPTSMTAAMLDAYGAASVEALLHAATARGHAPFSTEPAARILTAQAAEGDVVAAGILQTHGSELGAYAVVAARRVGLSGERFPLVLAGSVMPAAGILRDAVVETFLSAERGAWPVVPTLSPAAGALLLSFDAEGLTADTSTWD